jgi:predicted amidophosphoribosyltransferase
MSSNLPPGVTDRMCSGIGRPVECCGCGRRFRPEYDDEYCPECLRNLREALRETERDDNDNK